MTVIMIEVTDPQYLNFSTNDDGEYKDREFVALEYYRLSPKSITGIQDSLFIKNRQEDMCYKFSGKWLDVAEMFNIVMTAASDHPLSIQWFKDMGFKWYND